MMLLIQNSSREENYVISLEPEELRTDTIERLRQPCLLAQAPLQIISATVQDFYSNG